MGQNLIISIVLIVMILNLKCSTAVRHNADDHLLVIPLWLKIETPERRIKGKHKTDDNLTLDVPWTRPKRLIPLRCLNCRFKEKSKEATKNSRYKMPAHSVLRLGDQIDRS